MILLQQYTVPNFVQPMATDGDDVLDGELLRTVVRAASLAALHVVQEEKTRTARTMAQWAVVLGAFDDDEDTENEDDVAPGEKRSRRVRERKDWRTSGWWIQLQDTDLLDYTTDAAKVFRGRFRVPHPFFVELVKLAKEKKWFSRGQVDAAGREGIPVELKVRARTFEF